MLTKLVDERKPAFLAVAMDAPGKTFRDELDERYKANRPPPPPDLPMQMERCKEIVEAYRIPIFVGDGLEADDFLGQNPLGDWVLAPATTAGQAFSGLPELVPVNGRAQALIGYKRGTGHEKMVLYYPNNEMIVNGADGQVQTY
jgi:hypothetical protein